MRIDRSKITAILGLAALIGGKKVRTFVDALTAAVNAYDDVRAFRARVRDAAVRGEGIALTSEEAADLNARLLPLDTFITSLNK